ncbi:MAG: hypothetical protein QXQ94_07820 [Candidatus Bathyarchaeia archaeon]
MTDQNVRIAFLRVEVIVGTSVHTIFGEDHKCAFKLKELGAVADGEAERRE